MTPFLQIFHLMFVQNNINCYPLKQHKKILHMRLLKLNPKGVLESDTVHQSWRTIRLLLQSISLRSFFFIVRCQNLILLSHQHLKWEGTKNFSGSQSSTILEESYAGRVTCIGQKQNVECGITSNWEEICREQVNFQN